MIVAVPITVASGTVTRICTAPAGVADGTEKLALELVFCASVTDVNVPTA